LLRLAAWVCLGGSLAGCPVSPSRRPTPRPRPPTTTSPTPTPTPSPTPADPTVEIVSQGRHTCARRQSGQVQCWGKNLFGQLGDGSTQDRRNPVAVTGLGEATALAVGLNHSCALTRRGTVMCWGNNEQGQLGDGNGGRPGAGSQRPVQVRGLTDAVQISSGTKHACALRRGGAVVCWGSNANGQVGEKGADRATTTPVPVPELSQVAEVRAGGNHTCARQASGGVLCWGRNTEGELGDDSHGGRLNARPVVGLADAVALASGGAHSCAKRRAGTFVCWGANSHGALGDGNTGEFAVRKPVIVVGLRGEASLVLGGAHSCALSGGRVLCWGSNAEGQVDGTRQPRPRPTPVRDLTDVVDLALGEAHSCALQSSGNVTCWGSNEHSALGRRALR
ncbi:MAG: hypothetical protein KC486_10410, partial [Myxococcales bacterium]|nr:hypothetical protein [Myxococcales bacterium]